MWLCVTINAHDLVLFFMQKNTNMWLCVINLFYIPGFCEICYFFYKNKFRTTDSTAVD